MAEQEGATELSLLDAIAVAAGIKRKTEHPEHPVGIRVDEPSGKDYSKPDVSENVNSAYDPAMAKQIMEGMFRENGEVMRFLSAVFSLQKNIPDLGLCISQAVSILAIDPQGIIVDLRRALLAEPASQEKMFEQDILGSLEVDLNTALTNLKQLRTAVLEQNQIIADAQEKQKLLQRQESELTHESEALQQKIELRKQSYQLALSAIRRQLQSIVQQFSTVK